jgi:hypothetical protein
VIAVAVRWYLRYGLSYRAVEELLAEREKVRPPDVGGSIGVGTRVGLLGVGRCLGE